MRERERERGRELFIK